MADESHDRLKTCLFVLVETNGTWCNNRALTRGKDRGKTMEGLREGTVAAYVLQHVTRTIQSDAV